MTSNFLHPTQNEYLNCIRCGLCLSVCPTYREYLSETTSPRGRVFLTRKGLEGEMEITPNLIEQMYGCFACLACNDACPVGIKPADLAMQMRWVQEQINPSRWKLALFGELVPNPERMEMTTLALRLYERTGMRRLVYSLGLRNFFPGQLKDLEAMLPHLPQRPLRQSLPQITEAKQQTKYRVGFFLGCAQNLLFSEESAATVRVLSRNGCTVITPKQTVCCGMPSAGYGRQDFVLDQARKNISIFESINVDTIVTDCATCGSTLKEYGTLLAKDLKWAERAAAFSKKVKDISEFLISIPLQKPKGVIDGRVTYHDPCHLRRGQGIWEQPRDLLKLIDGIEFTELPEADWCCGSAGSQLITHYQTSLKVLSHKMDSLENTQADFIASGCPGCQMQLSVGVKKRKLKIQVVHPIQLLDKAYQNE